MKTLAILDNDALDQAFGGVSRAVSPGQLAQSPRGSALDIKQLASDFGFAMPNELASTFDAVEGLVGELASGDAGGWCGSEPAMPAPELAGPELGCTMDVSGADAYDTDAYEAASDACGDYDAADVACGDAYDDDACAEPPACGDDLDATPDAEIAADGEVCGTLPPGGSWDEEPVVAEIAPSGAAGASGGVIIGEPIDRGGSSGGSGGWFHIDTSQFAQYASASSPATMTPATSVEPAAADRPYGSFADAPNVRDHRGR